MWSPTVGALWGVGASEVGVVRLGTARAYFLGVWAGTFTAQVPMHEAFIALYKPEQ